MWYKRQRPWLQGRQVVPAPPTLGNPSNIQEQNLMLCCQKLNRHLEIWISQNCTSYILHETTTLGPKMLKKKPSVKVTFEPIWWVPCSFLSILSLNVQPVFSRISLGNLVQKHPASAKALTEKWFQTICIWLTTVQVEWWDVETLWSLSWEGPIWLLSSSSMLNLCLVYRNWKFPYKLPCSMSLLHYHFFPTCLAY